VRGPTVEVVTIDDGPSVTVRVDGKNAKLVKGRPRHVEGYVLTLTKLKAEKVTLRAGVASQPSGGQGTVGCPVPIS